MRHTKGKSGIQEALIRCLLIRFRKVVCQRIARRFAIASTYTSPPGFAPHCTDETVFTGVAGEIVALQVLMRLRSMSGFDLPLKKQRLAQPDDGSMSTYDQPLGGAPRIAGEMPLCTDPEDLFASLQKCLTRFCGWPELNASQVDQHGSHANTPQGVACFLSGEQCRSNKRYDATNKDRHVYYVHLFLLYV